MLFFLFYYHKLTATLLYTYYFQKNKYWWWGFFLQFFVLNKCAYNEVPQGGRAVLQNIGLGIYFSLFRYIGIIRHTKRINKKSRGIFPAFTHFSSFKTRSFVSRTFNSRSACSFFRLNSFSSNFISHLDFSSKSFLPHFVFSS